MFVLIVDYIKPLAEVDVVAPAHRAYLDQIFAAKKLIASGRQIPPIGGVLLSHVKTRAEVDEIIDHDPYVMAGVGRYTVLEFDVMKYDPGFAPFLSP